MLSKYLADKNDKTKKRKNRDVHFKVNQIKAGLLAMFEAHLDLSDLNMADAQREQKVLTRCLAALAIRIQTGCNAVDAARAVWDGTGDNGIDAAYFDPTDSTVVFSQSKWISKGVGEPEEKDILLFTRGVRDTIEEDFTGFDSRLTGKFQDIVQRLRVPGTRVRIVLTSTGASSLATPGATALDSLLDELNGNDDDPFASKVILGLSEVFTGLVNDPMHGSVALSAQILEWSYIPVPYQAYFGLIDGCQLKEWWKTYGKRLLSGNIRHSLGSTEVNNEIRTTALTKPEHFWYFNNGITLVAEDKEKAPASATSRSAGYFTLKGASVVNGAQTISALASVENDAALGQVRVSIRIILLTGAPEGFGLEVTRTNNLQNRIEPRDFVAQDPEQNRLRQEMAIEGIDYQILRSEESTQTETACELIEVTTALACASGDSSHAVQVKTGISRFFMDLKRTPYKALFNQELSGAKAFNAVLVYRAVEKWIEQQKKEIAKKSGSNWGVLVHGNRILAAAVFTKYGLPRLTCPIANFRSLLNQGEIDELCVDVYHKMVDTINLNYTGKFMAVLFKNPSMSKVVFENATTIPLQAKIGVSEFLAGIMDTQ